MKVQGMLPTISFSSVPVQGKKHLPVAFQDALKAEGATGEVPADQWWIAHDDFTLERLIAP